MDNYVKVNIEWIKPHIELYDIPDEGIRFCPQIKFEEEGDKLPQWTAEIVIKNNISKSLCAGYLRYLFEQAPDYLLKRGKRFVVFDGSFPIANGEILTDLIK